MSRELARRGVGQRLLYSSGRRVGFRGQQQAGDRHMNSGDAEKMGPPGLGDGGMWVMKSRGALRGSPGFWLEHGGGPALQGHREQWGRRGR